MRKYFWVLFLAVALGVASMAKAEREPMAGPADSRMRTVNYNPRDVVRIVGHYGFSTMLQFADYEVIENIAMGDSLAWQVVPNERGNILFVKPLEQNAETNLTVITSAKSPYEATGENPQRIYVFALEAERGDDHRSQAFTWHIRFQYPQDEVGRQAEIARGRALHDSALVSIDGEASTVAPASWNLRYTFAGAESQVPVRVFDNGQFTYFEFDDVTDTPAIFLVDKDRDESLVNSVREGKYIVVHRVARQFTLRNGAEVTCIFNESFTGLPELDQGSPVRRSEVRGMKSAEAGR